MSDIKTDDYDYTISIPKDKFIDIFKKLSTLDDEHKIVYSLEIKYALSDALKVEYYAILDIFKMEDFYVRSIIKGFYRDKETIDLRFDFPSTYYDIRDKIKELNLND